ncbi:MAG: hypothetical protein Q7S27_04290 [Nanoarchaeota archaeon]|nr:hypothetical protein [Nanoarchaeota archaeon]
MGVIEEIGKMRQLGKSEQEIAQLLQQRGISDQEISNLVSQSQIKEAVMASVPTPLPAPEQEMPPQQYNQEEYRTPYFGARPATEELGTSGEQYPQQSPSIPAQTQEEYSQEQFSQNQQEYTQDQYPSSPQNYPEQEPQSNYDYNQQYASSISSDTITEIAEQIVEEKISRLRNNIEKTIDLKTTLDAKLFNLNERLQRIEKIIDRLQLSILQKVGEYVVNVSDLKKELIETQKSFKSISENHTHHTSQSPHHHAEHHHSQKSKHKP